MRVLVTGATGFAGRWLIRELERTGHEAVATPASHGLDITDATAVGRFVRFASPDAVAHLAGLAFAPDARRDPARAMAVNAGGTRAVLAAAADLPVLVVSSAEVYGAPEPADLPLDETSPLAADQPYGRSKVAQEEEVSATMGDDGRRVAIVRPFNHVGPGQRPDFVVPALARRILDARDRGDTRIVAGNVDVRRDFSDVRDVVRAYRLVLESLVAGAPSPAPRIYNVASGHSVAIRAIIDAFARLAGVEVMLDVDPSLVRAVDSADIRGDASRIAAELGWRPEISLETSLADVLDDIELRLSARPT